MGFICKNITFMVHLIYTVLHTNRKNTKFWSSKNQGNCCYCSVNSTHTQPTLFFNSTTVDPSSNTSWKDCSSRLAGHQRRTKSTSWLLDVTFSGSDNSCRNISQFGYKVISRSNRWSSRWTFAGFFQFFFRRRHLC
jgi:hypothetical protein